MAWNYILITLVSLPALILIVTKAAGWKKPLPGGLQTICMMSLVCAVLMLMLKTLDFNARIPDSGLYHVKKVELPEYEHQKQIMELDLLSLEGYDTSYDVKFLIGVIDGFNHCCDQRGEDCGCLEIDSSFWAHKATAKAVPCHGERMKPYSDCGQ